MKRAVRAQGRTAITASKREGPLSRSNRRDSEGPLTPGKDLKAIPFKVPAREPVSWGNEEATGERDLGSGD